MGRPWTACARRSPEMEGPRAFAAIDCETTGLDASSDSLLQLAVCVVHPEGSRGWSTLVDPGRPVPQAIQRLTGISPERLAGAPGPDEALAQFRALVGDLPLVAHQASFDTGFIRQGLRRAGLPPLEQDVYDTLEMARLLDPAAGSHRLEDLVRARNLELTRAHDALADATATAALFSALLNELEDLEPELRDTLAYLAGPLGTPLARLVVGDRAQAVPHLPPAAEDEDGRPEGAGDPARSLDAIEALLSPGSALARRLKGFEVRGGQRQMMHAVRQALEGGRHLVVEAGTGTGKSLAYLLPALAWAAGQGSRVVVATHTVNLQEQLLSRDAPMALGSADPGGRVALLKGRAHYLCLKLWQEHLASPPSVLDAARDMRLASWLWRTRTGDSGELGLYGEDAEYFATLSTEAVACTGRRCPLYERCFLYRARRRAERADVVVANHALVFADIGREGSVLPAHEYLVLDEAHHLEDEAALHLGHVVGERSLERFFAGLAHGASSLTALRAVLEPLAGADPGGAAARARRLLERALSPLEVAREAAGECMNLCRAWAQRRDGGGYARATVRLEPRPEPGRDPVWDALAEAGRRTSTALEEVGRGLQHAAEALEPEEAAAAGLPAERVAALGAQGQRASEFAVDLLLCLGGREGWVSWLEVPTARGGGSVVLRASPVDVAEILRNELFAPKRSVILTSATLSVGGRFGYFRTRLGLGTGSEAERTDELAVSSPFRYREQALLVVPTDLPPVSGTPADVFARGVGPWLVRLLVATRGHALVLFTSNRHMREMRAELGPALESRGIACLAQGLDGGRSALASALRRNEETVVLGSASFWEGVDVPGDALRCVVLAQLPFWPPDMPLQQARQEAVAARGLSPFRELQLPQAVLRFKQGFGRLIRSTSDRGVAVVLDGRLVTQPYGRAFVDSLPGPEVHAGPAEEVLERAVRWLNAGMPSHLGA